MKILLSMIMAMSLLSMADYSDKYPVGDFVSPVNRDIILSGTFGELRTNHFHAGLDIKSRYGRSGDPVYAAAGGFISRIQVQEYGYGNVLYLDHPNGFTSVYAHLDQFAPEIEEFVKHEQYKRESFEVNLFPAPFQFPVDQLQQIGTLGNSGYSFGPHLHFEIRHSDTQTPVNPLHFGISVEDTLPPVIQHLVANLYGPSGKIVNSMVLQPKWSERGEYYLEKPVETGSNKVSFAIRVIDYQNGANNQNGIYSLSCHADHEPCFGFVLDEISFQNTRYLNAHIDYRMKVYHSKYYHRCYPLEGNKLPIYFTGVDEGILFLNPEIPRNMSIQVADFHNNVSKIQFEIRHTPSLLLPGVPEEPYDQIGSPEKVTSISKPGIQVVWPKGSFYEKVPIHINTIPAESAGNLSAQYELNPTDIPVHYYFEVSLNGLQVPPRLQEKAFIGRCDANGEVNNCGGKWIGNNLITGVRQMGTYAILVDTIPPSIKTIQFSSNMKGWKKMTFNVSDDFKIRDKGRDLRYNAKVDGQWILMAMDGKSGTLTHEFDGRIPPGDHELVLRVTDDRGNETILQKSFTL